MCAHIYKCQTVTDQLIKSLFLLNIFITRVRNVLCRKIKHIRITNLEFYY